MVGVRRVSQFVSLVFVGAGLFMVFGGLSLGLTGLYGPGVGFVAFWVGVPLTLLSAIWFGQVTFQAFPLPTEPFMAGRGAWFRVVSVTVALIAFTALLTPLGFDLSMLLLLLFLFFGFGRTHGVLKVVIAFAGSFGVHYVFEGFLKVPLPYSSFEFLRALGI